MSNLTMHLLQAVNTSTFNIADFFREFQLATQHTIEAAIQVQVESLLGHRTHMVQTMNT